MSASPTGEFVATAHVAGASVALWTDKAAYERVDAAPRSASDPAEPLTKPSVADLLGVAAPAVSVDADAAIALEGAGAHDAAEAAQAPLAPAVLADNSEKGVLRLSGLPRQRAETLRALEAVASRNRPTAPPKKPEAAPFFLPAPGESAAAASAPSSAAALPPAPPELDACDDDDASDASDTGLDAAAGLEEDARSRCGLAAASLSGDAGAVLAHLADLGAANVDAEIALLCRGPHDAAGIKLVRSVAALLADALRGRDDFDAVQAYVFRLVQHHSAVLGMKACSGEMAALASAQRDAAARFRDLVDETACLLETAANG